MNPNQVMNDRDLIARILTQNLRQYGNLEPAGFYTRPMHGTGDELRMMSRANYLRVAAYLHEDSPQNPHYISQEEADALHLAVKPKARPVYLEYWTRTADGGYSADIVPYYNIEDTVGRHNRIDAFRHDIPEHDTPKQVQDAASYLGMTEVPKTGEAIRDFAYQTGLAEELTPVEAKAFSQLVLKDFHLTSNFSQNPLYSEEEIQSFENNPRLLFQAITRASTLEHNLPVLLAEREASQTTPEPEPVQEAVSSTPESTLEPASKPEQETIEEPKPESSKPQEPKQELVSDKPEPVPESRNQKEETKASSSVSEQKPSTPASKPKQAVAEQEGSAFPSGLVVDLKECNLDVLRDLKGNPYTNNSRLVGAQAYEFLVRLNELDKAHFSHPITSPLSTDDGVEYGDISFTVAHGKNNKSNVSIDLTFDSLYFQNASSVTEMIGNYMLAKYRHSLDSPSELAETFAPYQDTLKKEIEKVEKNFLAPLKKEEDAYLANHPELKAINEKSVTPYIYICRKEDYGNFSHNDLAKSSIKKVPEMELKNYCVMPLKEVTDILEKYTEPNGTKDIDERCLKIRNGLPQNMIAFYSTKSPSNQMCSQTEMLFAMPKKELEKLRPLRHFSIMPSRQNGVLDIDSNSQPERFWGIKAIYELGDCMVTDYERYTNAVRDRIAYPGENPDVTLLMRWDFENTGEPTEILGTGKMTNTILQDGIESYLPKFRDNPEKTEKVRKELLKAIDTFTHYGNPYISFQKEFQSSLLQQPLPSEEESLRTWEKNKPTFNLKTYNDETEENNTELFYDVYRKYALIFSENDTVAQVWKSATQKMLDSGHTRQEIKNMATRIEQFDKTAGKGIAGFLPTLQKHTNQMTKD